MVIFIDLKKVKLINCTGFKYVMDKINCRLRENKKGKSFREES